MSRIDRIESRIERFKDWWNAFDEEYSKSYQYNNRVHLIAGIWISIFFGGMFLLAVLPELRDTYFTIVWFGFSCFYMLFYFIFIQPSHTFKFPYIAKVVKREVDGQELTMYEWDEKLFYSLSDVEVYEEIDPEGIKFIDLKNNKHIENIIDADKLWEKAGESHKSFKVFEKPKITPELKKLMPDLIESEEE